MWYDTNPYEVGYGYKWMVELEQEQHFIGKEALRRISEEGVSRKLVGVEIGGGGFRGHKHNTMSDFFSSVLDWGEDRVWDPARSSPPLVKKIGVAKVLLQVT